MLRLAGNSTDDGSGAVVSGDASAAIAAMAADEATMEAAPLLELPRTPDVDNSGAEYAEGSAAAPNSAGGTPVDAHPDSGRWYFQEATTRQPAGPWTVAQLRARWRRNQINGLTPVWRDGLEGGWKPLADVDELKAAFRATAEEEGEEEEGPTAKRYRRAPLDEVPLTHTYTSEQGVLYVYDEADEDWKASDVYEVLLREEAEAEAVAAAAARARDEAAEAASVERERAEKEQEDALRELLADTGASTQASSSGGASRRAAALSAATTAMDLAAAAAATACGSAPGCSGAMLAGATAPERGAAGGATSGAPVDQETEDKRQKRREYRERRKLKRQAGVFVKAQANPNIYVSGLPPDVTLQEVEPIFKKAGVLKVDPDTGGPKIRIYLTADGKTCKGDALVSYANSASVELAVKFLHEFELRPKTHICVQQADFEEHERDIRLSKVVLKELAATRRTDADRLKYLAAKNAQKEAVSWSGEMDDGTGRRIVVLKHLFSLQEAEREGPEFYAELADEVREECEKIGQVAKVTPMERHKQGIVCVKFKTSCEAEECIRVMDGRYFAGRAVEASFYDGCSDLRVLGNSKPAERPPRIAAVAAAVASAKARMNPTNADVPQLGLAGAVSTETMNVSRADTSSPARDEEAPGAHVASAQVSATAASELCVHSAKDAATGKPTADLADEAALAGAALEPPRQSASKDWEEWLDNQSSGSDEEMHVRVEE